MSILARINSGPYKVVLLLHILCAIVGLGGVMLNGIYAVASRKAVGQGALVLVRANAKATKIAELFIYAVPIFGFALIGMSDDGWGFDQTWVWLSVVLYAIALAIAVGLLLPSSREYERVVAQIESTGAAPTPQLEASLDGLLKKQGVLGSSLHVLTVVLLYLMIWKPGA
ncbi:MAG: DUF2269 family protein [Acidimicrobiales bacterium]